MALPRMGMDVWLLRGRLCWPFRAYGGILVPTPCGVGASNLRDLICTRLCCEIHPAHRARRGMPEPTKDTVRMVFVQAWELVSIRSLDELLLAHGALIAFLEPSQGHGLQRVPKHLLNPLLIILASPLSDRPPRSALCKGSPKGSTIPLVPFPDLLPHQLPLCKLRLPSPNSPHLAATPLQDLNRESIEARQRREHRNHPLAIRQELGQDWVAVEVEDAQALVERRKHVNEPRVVDLVFTQVENAQLLALAKLNHLGSLPDQVARNVQVGKVLELGNTRQVLKNIRAKIERVQVDELLEAREAVDPVAVEVEHPQRTGQVAQPLDNRKGVALQPERLEVHKLLQSLNAAEVVVIQVELVV
mmetsp:Transcript_31403/g.76970  ORF Transcript_31403/g.76970 Transcript_31403/m.76970 type:complete len:360 (-) Transcript_31403:14-1093(-)